MQNISNATTSTLLYTSTQLVPRDSTFGEPLERMMRSVATTSLTEITEAFRRGYMQSGSALAIGYGRVCTTSYHKHDCIPIVALGRLDKSTGFYKQMESHRVMLIRQR